jgi:hypothetical protein
VEEVCRVAVPVSAVYTPSPEPSTAMVKVEAPVTVMVGVEPFSVFHVPPAREARATDCPVDHPCVVLVVNAMGFVAVAAEIVSLDPVIGVTM